MLCWGFYISLEKIQDSGYLSSSCDEILSAESASKNFVQNRINNPLNKKYEVTIRVEFSYPLNLFIRE